MTFPITVKHAIGSALTRYTQVPSVNADPGGGSEPAGGGGRITLGGKAGASGTVSTIYGYNWNNFDNTQQTIAGRKAKFGNRVPCVRVYGTGGLTSTFTVSTSVAEEKRVCYSFKAGGSFTSSTLTGTTARNTMISWLQDIPANWTVFWVYHHEPNSSSGLEVPQADFLGTYTNMMAAKAAASLQPGVKVYVTSNFMAYQVDTTNWSDAWVPSCDILTWDMYGNPGQQTSSTGSNKYGTATGSAYGSTYPLIDQRTAAMFRVTERTGFAASWGILEVNTPVRNWDTNEAGRKAWHQDCINYFNAPPMAGKVPPKIVLLWEAPSGANWNQSYGFNTPQGTNTGDPDLSPIWNVWKPYMTGTPVGG